MRILLIEDEERLSNVIKTGLQEEGFAIDQAFDGEEGLYLAENESYDLIVLDYMLPKKDGAAISKLLRQKSIQTPIIMLTAKSQTEDKIAGLEAGADDYLTKPFEFGELKARIQALLRRSHRQTEYIITIADLTVDPAKHVAKRDGLLLNLTPKEFAIVELLARHKGEVVTRTQIIEHTWDYNFDAMSNVVDVFIAAIRKKVDGKHGKKLLHTIHGVGYKLSETV